jgi:predicted nucleic acid-binding protein
MAEVLVVSPYVLAELDYLITTRIGVAAELAMVSATDLGTAADIVERHQELNIGLTDASLVARTVRGLRSRPYCQVDAG